MILKILSSVITIGFILILLIGTNYLDKQDERKAAKFLLFLALLQIIVFVILWVKL